MAFFPMTLSSSDYISIFLLSLLCNPNSPIPLPSYVFCIIYYPYLLHFLIILNSGANSGGSAPGARPPLKLGKNMIFWRKIVIFHTKYPNNFRASLRSAQFFFEYAPPNLKFWIRPWNWYLFELCMVQQKQ